MSNSVLAGAIFNIMREEIVLSLLAKSDDSHERTIITDDGVRFEQTIGGNIH